MRQRWCTGFEGFREEVEHSGGRVAQRGLRQAFHPRRPTRPPLFLGITSMGRFTVTYSSASPSGSMAAPISLNGFQARAGLLASGRANMPWYVTVTIAYRTTTAKPRFRQLSPRVAHHRTPKNGNARSFGLIAFRTPRLPRFTFCATAEIET